MEVVKMGDKSPKDKKKKKAKKTDKKVIASTTLTIPGSKTK
jgi:hypothetical protein